MPAQPTMTLPACSFAALGPGALTACPGYRPSRMRREVVRWFRPEPLPTPRPDGMTCAHLGHQLSLRGFRSACACPGGLPEGAAEIAERVARSLAGPGRRAPRRADRGQAPAALPTASSPDRVAAAHLGR
jgi:hypothetical protein